MTGRRGEAGSSIIRLSGLVPSRGPNELRVRTNPDLKEALSAGCARWQARPLLPPISARGLDGNRIRAARAGFTLIEMMVAVGLCVLLMTLVVSVMSQVMESINHNRATIETADRLRYVRERLQKDLAGITVFAQPPPPTPTNPGEFGVNRGGDRSRSSRGGLRT
jgi:prepilin-type N-terminal cleavage/methylation domain-containing protein